MNHQKEAVEPPYPNRPQSVTSARKYSPVCLPGASEQERQSTLAAEAEDFGSGEAVIGRLSEGFRNLTTEEQRQAILAAKRKPATSIADEIAKVDEKQEKGDYVATAEQSVS